VARRKDGIKIYEKAMPFQQDRSPEKRLAELVLLIAKILSPVPESSLRSALNHLGYSVPDLSGRKTIVKTLIDSGALLVHEVEGIRFLSVTDFTKVPEPPSTVRILAPFDPLVWDRRRFEALWGWAYRFEAYTPPAKRRMGYYAMPLLYADNVIGWANAALKDGKLHIETGFAGKTPKERAFRTAFDEEVDRMKLFLGVNS
jgi:uncharacterized protein YcaQ